jgi:hypothetical protein
VESADLVFGLSPISPDTMAWEKGDKKKPARASKLLDEG